MISDVLELSTIEVMIHVLDCDEKQRSSEVKCNDLKTKIDIWKLQETMQKKHTT